jgi:hypothetical protein
MRLSLAVLPALLLAGCAVGPNYKRPAVAVPDQYRGAAADAASLADKKWSELFADDALRQLVETALQHNFDLGIASERVLEARAQYHIARANEFPNVTGQAGFTAARTPGASSLEPLPPNASYSGSYWQVGLALNWELDFWGRLRRLSESGRALYLATEEGRRGVVVSLIGDVMSDYFLLRERDLELEIAQQTRDSAQHNLRLVELRHTRGASTGLDVHQAEQFLYTATAQMASARRDIEQTENALSLLAGKAPGEIARGKALLCRHRRHQRLQKLVRHAEAALVLLREVGAVVCRVVELVFVLDVHGARVAHFREHAEEALPIHRAASRQRGNATSAAVHGLDAAAFHHVPENLRVLQMDIVNLVGEFARRRHRVHELPDQVRRIELQPTCGLSLKALNSASQPTGPVAMLGPPA